MNNKINALKSFLVLFVLLFSAASVSALSMIGQFDNGKTSESIMPGQSAGYYVLVTADQNLSTMNITGNLYDTTTGDKVFLVNLFNASTSETFFYPPEYSVLPSQYQNLPGKYVIEITSEELLTTGFYESKTVELNLKVLGNRLPIANFTYTPNINITTAMPVTFTSTSYDTDGYLVKEEWFVDSVKVGQGRNIVYQFNQARNYNVTLRVIDNDGGVATHTEIISVGQGPITGYPVANFSNSTDLCANTLVSFKSNSYDSDGAIVLQEWDLNNDGVYESTGSTASRIFVQPNTYTVWLRVTDDSGLQSTISKSFTVAQCGVVVNIPPVANFTYVPASPFVNQTVIFTSTSYDPDGTIVKEEWDLNNDGVYETLGHNTSKIFSQSGAYLIKLRVTDNNGAQAVASQFVIVQNIVIPNIPPVADFIYAPQNVTTITPVTFVSTSYDVDGTIVSYAWFFDGVLFGTGSTISHTFTTVGNHTATLIVTDDDGATGSATKTIVVANGTVVQNIPPVADFIYVPQNNITTLTQVDFTSTSYDVDGTIVSYRWYVDQVLVGNASTMGTVFSTEGTHSVTLIVTDDDGANSLKTKNIVVANGTVVQNIPPVADFVYSPLNPTSGNFVTFNSTSYDVDGTIVSYAWFIDGVNVANTPNMVHAFLTEGTYNVMLKVTDDDGASSTATKNIVVGQSNVCGPKAVLRTPESIYMGNIAKMDATLSQPGCNAVIILYRWQIYRGSSLLGDFTSTTPYFSYNFTKNGAHRVVLTVYNNNSLSDSDEKIVYAGTPVRGIQKGAEDGLYVDYFDVTGSSYGVIEAGEDFTVTATVSNDRDDDIKDLRVTFAIPELGYQIKSDSFRLDAGHTKTVSINGHLDFAKGEISSGDYYAFIGASDTDTIRVKYFPLTIN